MTGAEAYPLSWPLNRPRSKWRNASRFDVTLAKARDGLFHELDLLGATKTVLSTNLRLRNDGLPAAGQAEPCDPGVAVYFTWKGRNLCFACDRWDKVGDNMQAVRHTIAAVRGIARWGTGDMVEAAFTGFVALPAPKSWRAVLGLNGDVSRLAVDEAYKRLAMTKHPDRGGSQGEMAELNDAVDRARKEVS